MKSKMMKQVLYDMRHQPVIGVVSVIGTAMSIFLIMIMVMMARIETMPFAPESNRDRLLYGRNINTANKSGGSSSSRLHHLLAKNLYGDLKEAEVSTIMTNDPETVDVTVPGQPSMLKYLHYTDENFWKVFDYEFIAGHPYDKVAVDAGSNEVVIAESVARKLFGTTDVAGREILVLQTPYRVVGVVGDASPLAKSAFADLFIPYTVNGCRNVTFGDNGVFGPMQAVILARSEEDFPAIRNEVMSRIRAFDSELRQLKGDSVVYHGQPYTQYESNYVKGSNTPSEADSQTRLRWIIYGIFLLVPAINLSSMTQSRLRRRTSEIGVRRAFGCKRSTLIANVIAENMIVTLAGGIIGLAACLIFGYFFTDFVFTDLDVNRQATVSLRLLIDWKLYAAVIFFCFLLNLLSSGVPAWRASRIPPVDAINNHTK